MWDLKLFVAGLAMGLAIAAPLGPVNIIVIRQVLAKGAAAGVIAGLGAIAADGFFAAVTAFGLKAILKFFAGHATAIGLVGGALLVIMGVVTARQSVAFANGEAKASGPSARATVAAFSATITNPGALLGVFAVFAGMSPVLRLADHPARPAVVLAAFAAGGLLWWLALSAAVSRLRHKLSANTLGRINRWTGIVIAAFGFALLFEILG